jgi:hypothetical protein
MAKIPLMVDFSVFCGTKDYEEVDAVKQKCGKLANLHSGKIGKGGLAGLDEKTR